MLTTVYPDLWTRFRFRQFKSIFGQGFTKGISWFFQILEFLLFIPLTMFLLVLLYRTFQAFSAGQSNLAASTGTAAGAIATLFLVGITLRYARTTRLMAESMQNEQKRPFIISLIADGIDNFREWLDRDREDWALGEPDSNWRSYPDLTVVVIPNSYRADLKSNYPIFMKILERYESRHMKYQEIFGDLVDEIAEYLETKLDQGKLAEHIEDIIPPELNDEGFRNGWGRTDSTNLIIQEKSRQLAHSIITDTPSDRDNLLDNLGVNSLCQHLFLAAREELMQIRELNQFSNDFTELSSLLNSMKEENQKVYTGFQWIRNQNIQQYDILETEIQNSETQNRFVT